MEEKVCIMVLPVSEFESSSGRIVVRPEPDESGAAVEGEVVSSRARVTVATQTLVLLNREPLIDVDIVESAEVVGASFQVDVDEVQLEPGPV